MNNYSRKFNLFVLFSGAKMCKLREWCVCSLTICLAMLFFAVGCNRNIQQRHIKGCFRYNDPDGFQSLDPLMAGYRSAVWAADQLYNGLVAIDTTGAIVPVLARSWEVDSTGVEWRFFLRTDVFFHEDACFGQAKTRKMTAQDVAYSLTRVCDARNKSTGAWVLRDKIVGAEKFFEQTKRVDKATPSSIPGIRVENDSTLVLTIVRPFAPFLALLTTPYCSVVPREAVEYYRDDFFKHPVGTGPFFLSSWKEGQTMVLRKNTRYFEYDSRGRRLPYLDSVVVSFLRDPKQEFLSFKEGRFDFISSVDAAFSSVALDNQGRLRSPFSDDMYIQRVPAHSIDYYGILLDTTSEIAASSPLSNNRALRKALNFAVDREKIAKFVLHNSAVPAHNGVLPPGFPGFSTAVKGYRYNIDSARYYLQKAGYPNGKGLPVMTLQLGHSEKTASVAEAVQQQLGEIGVRIDLKLVDFPQHLTMVRAGKLPFWRTSWGEDYPDPENFLALFVSSSFAPGGPNTTKLHTKSLDSLYALAMSPALEPQQRFALYNAMETQILEETPWVFLYHNVIQRLIKKHVSGFYTSGADKLTLKYVQVH